MRRRHARPRVARVTVKEVVRAIGVRRLQRIELSRKGLGEEICALADELEREFCQGEEVPTRRAHAWHVRRPWRVEVGQSRLPDVAGADLMCEYVAQFEVAESELRGDRGPLDLVEQACLVKARVRCPLQQRLQTHLEPLHDRKHVERLAAQPFTVRQANMLHAWRDACFTHLIVHPRLNRQGLGQRRRVECITFPPAIVELVLAYDRLSQSQLLCVHPLECINQVFRARAGWVSATHEGGQVIRAAVFADQPGVKGGERRGVQKRVGRRPPWWQKRHSAPGQARINEARPAIAVSHWIPYPRAGWASEPKLRAALAPSIPVVATTVTAGHAGACGAGSKHADQPRKRSCGDPRGGVGRRRLTTADVTSRRRAQRDFLAVLLVIFGVRLLQQPPVTRGVTPCCCDRFNTPLPCHLGASLAVSPAAAAAGSLSRNRQTVNRGTSRTPNYLPSC